VKKRRGERGQSQTVKDDNGKEIKDEEKGGRLDSLVSCKHADTDTAPLKPECKWFRLELVVHLVTFQRDDL
jgi:hypothetical protein